MEVVSEVSKSKVGFLCRAGKDQTLKRKLLAAQEAGAIGIIIFTDPGDDGEITEENGYEVYPNGPARQVSALISRSI